MRYKIQQQQDNVYLEVEASFSLLDFLALFACLLLGVFFAVFLWIFAAAILIRLFTKNAFYFDVRERQVIQYLQILSYIRLKRFTIPFESITHILFSDAHSGKALFERGLRDKEWLTLELVGKDKIYLITKTEEDEYEDIYQLFLEMESHLKDEFFFYTEFSEFEGNQ